MINHHNIIAGISGESGIVISNGNVAAYDCSTLTGWDTSRDGGFGDTTLYNFAGDSTFRLDGGVTYQVSNRAEVFNRAAYPAGDTWAYSVDVWHDSLGNDPGTGLSLFNMYIKYTSINLFTVGIWNNVVNVISSGAAWATVATIPALIQQWVRYTFVITPSTKTADIYINNTLLASGVDCGWEFSSSPHDVLGNIDFIQYSRETSYTRRISYITRVLIGDGLA